MIAKKMNIMKIYELLQNDIFHASMHFSVEFKPNHPAIHLSNNPIKFRMM